MLVTKISLGTLVIDDDIAVAAFSEAVITNNNDWREDDQITFFFAQQMIDNEGVLRASMDIYHMVLSTAAPWCCREVLALF